MKIKSIAALFSLAFALLVSSRAQTVDTLPLSGLFEPYGVAVDYTDGSVYISDSTYDQILRFDPADGTTALIGFAGGSPEGIVVYNDATFGHGLAVASTIDFTVRFIDLATGDVKLLAGTPGVSGVTDAAGASAKFRSPAGLAATSDGRIYVADLGANLVRIIGNDVNHTVTTLQATNDSGTVITFNRPTSVALAPGNTIFVADNRNNAVKKFVNNKLVSTAAVTSPRALLWLGGVNGLLMATDESVIRRAFGTASDIVPYAGKAGTFGFADGPLGSALFSQPTGLALDASGQVLIADLKNDRIRRIVRTSALTPIVNPAPATYTNDVVISAVDPIPNSTPRSVFKFTVDGNDPTFLSSTLPGGYVISGGPTPLKIRAYNPDFGNSAMVSNLYTFAVSPLAFDVDGGLGARSNNLAVAVTTATVGATIRFTTDGSTPTASSAVWANQTLSGTTTLQLAGFKNGYATTPVLSNKFVFFVNKPVITASTNTSNNDIDVTIRTETVGARLFYTDDGSAPASGNPTAIEVTSGNTFQLKRTGLIRVVGEKAGYNNSEETAQTFLLKVAPPTIIAAVTNSTAPIAIQFKDDTVGAKYRVTINGPIPNAGNSTLYTDTGFTLTNNGLVRIVAIRDLPGDKYEDSVMLEQVFGLQVARPAIQPYPDNSPTNIIVTVTNATPDAKIQYYVARPNGLNTATNTVDAGTPFTIDSAGTLVVVGKRAGFADSETVTAPIVLQVSNPSIAVTPSTSPAINKVLVGLTSASASATLRYTLDGSSPVTNLNAGIYSSPFEVDTNATLVVVATNATYFPSDILTRSIVIQADKPVLTPPGGFFQDGTTLTLTVDRTNAPTTFSTASTIYYTLDGSEPTTASTKYTGPFKVNALNFPTASLRLVKAKAFAGGVLASDTVQGELSTTNKIGISREITYAGNGAKIYVPVVVSLADGVEVRSLQYRVQVWPKAGAPNLDPAALQLEGFGTNDFFVLRGSLDGTVTNTLPIFNQFGTTTKTNDVAISFLANSSNLRLREFGTVSLLSIKLPTTAAQDAEYGIRILEASGTTDTTQGRVIFGSGPESDRTIKVKAISYVAGDSSPAIWYNAGDFGDGDLDNSDVNNAFYAALAAPLHSPPQGTDLFHSMDVFPLDVDGSDAGQGDNFIGVNDWTIIMQRALRLRTDNFVRYWTNGFVNPLALSITDLTRNTSPDGEATVIKPKGATDRWFRPASFEAQIRQSVKPGAAVSVPVMLTIKQGYTLRGMQFAARIESSDASLATPALVYTRGAVGPGINAGALPTGEAGYGWPVGSLELPAGVYNIGTLSFAVPANAAAGTTFTIRFRGVDGAQDIDTQLKMESVRGTVIVNGDLPADPFGKMSDEYMANFYGSVNNASAAANLDSDGDGVTNMNEFLAGTNPTEFRFHNSSGQTPDGFKLRFFAAPGKSYAVESSTAVGAEWTSIQGVAGDGSVKEVVDADSSDATKFYRVRVTNAQ